MAPCGSPPPDRRGDRPPPDNEPANTGSATRRLTPGSSSWTSTGCVATGSRRPSFELVEHYGLNDQDTMLAYVGPERCVLDPAWNALPILEDVTDPRIIHWASLGKPWEPEASRTARRAGASMRPDCWSEPADRRTPAARSSPPASSARGLPAAASIEPWRRGSRSSRSAAARSRSEPRQGVLPGPGYTKLDLVAYYLSVADGALPACGAADGAQALRRRLPRSRSSRSGRPRTARVDAHRRRSRFRPGARRRVVSTTPPARLDRQPRLHRPQSAPGARRRPGPSRRAARRPRPHARRRRGPIRDVAGWCSEVARRRWAWSAGRRRPGSRGIHIYVRIEPRWTFTEVRRAALALARDVERRAPDRDLASGGRRSATACSSTTTRTPRTARCFGLLGAAPPDARVSMPLRWDEVPDASRPRPSRSRPCPALFAALGDPGAGIDGAVGSLDALLELSARDEAEGQGDAPWPPNYAKQEGEPPRVQPSRKREPDEEYEPAAARTAGRRPRSRPSAPRPSPRAIRTRACRPSGKAPARRRRGAASRLPVIEIARAASKAEAIEGLERWKARHPEVSSTSSRRTSSSTGCVAAPRLVPASGSTSSTCRRPNGRPRSRSTPITTRGRATSGPTGGQPVRAPKKKPAPDGADGQ